MDYHLRIVYAIDEVAAQATANIIFMDGFPNIIRYTGPLVDSLLGMPNEEFTRTITFVDGFPSTDIWDDTLVALLQLTFDGGRITRVVGTDAEWLQDGGRITENSDLVSQDGGRFTYTGA